MFLSPFKRCLFPKERLVPSRCLISLAVAAVRSRAIFYAKSTAAQCCIHPRDPIDGDGGTEKCPNQQQFNLSCPHYRQIDTHPVFLMRPIMSIRLKFIFKRKKTKYTCAACCAVRTAAPFRARVMLQEQLQVKRCFLLRLTLWFMPCGKNG